MKKKRIFISILVVAVIAAIGVFFNFCDGECETRKCTVNQPCNVNGKRYVRGEICVNENKKCDTVLWWDCHCETRIIGAGPANNRPTCECI